MRPPPAPLAGSPAKFQGCPPVTAGLEFAPARVMPPFACPQRVSCQSPPAVKAPTLPVAGPVQTAPARLLPGGANKHIAPAPLLGPTQPALSPADFPGMRSQEAGHNLGANKLAALALPCPKGTAVAIGPEFADGPGTNNLAALPPSLLLPAGVRPEPAGLLPAPADLLPVPAGPFPPLPCLRSVPLPCLLQDPVGLPPARPPGTYTREVADDGHATFAALAPLPSLPCLLPLSLRCPCLNNC